jgi:crossover junction endodeoxyribonuclease RusA
VQFIVYGTPEPKGSTRAFMPKGARFPVVTTSNPNLKTWADLVRTTAQPHRETGGFVVENPVRLSLHFSLRRPQRLTTKPKRGLTLWHTTKPDLDKLTRAIKDALTGVLWTDDSQVAQLCCEKLYCDDGEGPCCHVTVEELRPARDLLS